MIALTQHEKDREQEEEENPNILRMDNQKSFLTIAKSSVLVFKVQPRKKI
jgi:hypothetical protein